ncbi:MAG: cytochrome c biogenesis protein CcdA [Dehalococcoidia bacterium]|nr:cytochrome c biogenesis protein CcdA [Dehalococcoidia bacterium]
MEHVSLLVAFGAGLLSFLSPCVLPLVPVYLASLCGPEIFEPEINRSRLRIFIHSLSFILGFSLVFIILGASAGLAGFVLSTSLTLIHKIAGSLLIIFGLFLIAALKIPWLNYERRLSPSLGTTTSYLRSFLIGAVFSLAWTPCVSPILGGILTLAWSSETAWRGAYLLASYSLGLGLPFLIIGVTFDSIRPLLKHIHRYSGWIYIGSGLLLIAVGILILTNNLVWL